MATVHGNIIKGTIGDRVYSFDPVSRQQVVRRKPKKVRNPKTEAQQAHRNAFVDIVRLSSHMTEAHRLGLRRHAQRERLRTYTYFRRVNKDCFTPDGFVDYPRVVLSYGPVGLVVVNEVLVDADHVLRLTFDACLKQANALANDAFHLFVYCPARGAGILAPPVPRSAGALTFPLPSDWPSDGLHLYAFLLDAKGRASSTIYIPLPEEPR